MADGESRGRPRVRTMVDSTKADWEAIARADAEYAQQLPEWLLSHLTLLEDDRHGFAIDRFQHSLQSATRAYRDGRDEEYVTCALMHDVGSALAPQDHAAFAAMILRPFVSEQNHWMLQQHSTFQGYYFFHHFGLDRNIRDQFSGHPWFEYTAQFCHLYDQVAFDPDYDNMPLEAFAPMVHRTLAVRKR
jgi:predicted HD phosphohydrolase